MDVLTDAAKSLDFVLEYPGPDVLFREFGDSYYSFEVRAWIRNVQDRPRLQSRMMIAVNNALSEAGIKIPFPQRDIHIIPTADGES